MSCENYKLRIADAAAALETVAPGFSLSREESRDPASAIFDSELAAHLQKCAACRAAFEKHVALFVSIDRGLAAMVAPEPSGDFAAHVRRRIAEKNAAPRPWFAGWQFISGAAVLVLVVLVGVLTIGRPPRPPQSARVTPPAIVVPAEKSPKAAVSAETQPLRAEVPRAIRPQRGGHSAVIREPEVLVPRGEMVAVTRLLNANWSGKADGASLTAIAAPMSEVLKPMTIEELKIPALEVVPLESAAPPKGSPEK
ncbi:MAG: hypothetical protein M1453_11960 [Acidobacteria bacterium]|nr:hypothetical protein [Acidobacteriota bacterium]